MTTIAQWYERVNAAWPDQVPPLTDAEAVRAARRLYRFAMKRPCPYPVEVTSGNRYTYARSGVLYVNPQGRRRAGWRDFVHELSHYMHRRLYPGERPHSRTHARLEMKLAKEVIRRGWLGGALKPAPKPAPVPKPDDRIERRQAQVARLERKIKALTTRLQKARRSLAALERAKSKKEGVTPCLTAA